MLLATTILNNLILLFAFIIFILKLLYEIIYTNYY